MKEIINGIHKYSILNRDFLEMYNPIISATTSYNEIANRIHEIECKAKSSNITLTVLVELCYQIVCRLPVPLIEIDVPSLIRARQGYSSNDKTFSSVGDLSYNPVIKNIKQGRFNIDKEPIFYACVPCQTPRGNTSLSAILESDKDLLNKKGSIDDKYSTVSKWNINKTFFAINFSMYNQAEKNNLSVNKINTDFIKKTLKYFSYESFASLLLLCRFMSEKAASKKKEDSDYLISNAYKQALEIYYGKDVRAIIYSSAMSEHNGLNIAVSKNLIDNGEIEFDGACVYKIQSHPYKLEKTLFPYTNYAKADSYGNFKFRFNNIKWIYH